MLVWVAIPVPEKPNVAEEGARLDDPGGDVAYMLLFCAVPLFEENIGKEEGAAP